MTNKQKFITKICLDLALWFLPFSVFLFEYQSINDDGIKGSGQFLFLTSFLFLFLSGLKIISEIILTTTKKTKSIFISFVTLTRGMIAGCMLLLFWIYLSVVFLGLYFWGSIPGLDLLLYYANRLNRFYGLYWLTQDKTYQILFMLWLVVSIFYLSIENFINWQKTFIAFCSSKVKIFLTISISFLLVISLSPFLTFDFNSFTLSITKERVGTTLASDHDFSENLEGHHFNKVLVKQIDANDQKIRETQLSKIIPSSKNPPNVVLIIVDALRYDHLQAYGYNRPTTPNLEKLRLNGQMRIINNMHSTCSDTACGVLGTISSKFAPQFSYNPITLHEILRDNHYTENLVLSGDHTFFYNLKKYYGNVDYYSDGTMLSNGGFSSDVNILNDDQKVINDLKTFKPWDKKPTFFQFHLMAAHVLRAEKYYSGLYTPFLNYMMPYNRDPKNEQAWLNFYDNGVWHMDDFVHQIFEILKEKGYLEDTVVFITGDHGDAMGEHGYFTHANTIYEQVTHIPLLLIDFNHTPAFTTQKNSYPAQVDIAPTILNELGLEKDIPSSWSGTPIGGEEQHDLIFMEERKDSGLIDKKSLNGHWKYWYNFANKKEKAFDLEKDPQEEHNQIDEVPLQLRKEWKACILSQTAAKTLKDCH